MPAQLLSMALSGAAAGKTLAEQQQSPVVSTLQDGTQTRQHARGRRDLPSAAHGLPTSVHTVSHYYSLVPPQAFPLPRSLRHHLFA